jgi:(p)ppGpp synthase/HD superfamily hydrolase
MFTESLVTRAELFAVAAHSAIGHERKYTKEPYIQHLYRVVEILKKISVDDEVLAAAWLHDILEDTDINSNILEQFFTDRIVSLVLAVTDVSDLIDCSRSFRKKLNRDHIALGSVDAKNIKLADGIDNMPSIIKYDPEFAVTYIEEKYLLFNEALTEGDARLKSDYMDIINGYYKTI